ncbi:MAG: hypothetical protein WC955_03220 [Elusimicrobiota bacterium]
MYNINLIRDEIMSPDVKKQLFWYTQIVMAVGVSILLVVIYQFISLNIQLVACEKKRNVIETKIKDYESNLNIGELISTWSKQAQQLQNVEKVLNERIVLAGRIQELGLLLPQKMCILKISFEKQSKNMLLEVAVSSKDGEELSQVKQYMDSLEKSKYFKPGVKLESQEEIVLKDNAKLFRISVPLGE